MVARHADVWNVNWPADPRARRGLGRCARGGLPRDRARAPSAISRRMWIFTRIRAALGRRRRCAEFRRWNPWFDAIHDAELAPALVVGTPAECRERLAEIARELRLEMPVLDLSGLDAAGRPRRVSKRSPRAIFVDSRVAPCLNLMRITRDSRALPAGRWIRHAPASARCWRERPPFLRTPIASRGTKRVYGGRGYRPVGPVEARASARRSRRRSSSSC